MKNTLVAVILFLPNLLFAQTDYYRYNNSTGTSEKIGYSEPSNNRSQFAPYVGLPVETYERIGRYKQQQYEQRLEVLQALVSRNNQLIIELNKYDPEKARDLNYKHNKNLEFLNESDWQSNFDTYIFYKQAFKERADYIQNLLNQQ